MGRRRSRRNKGFVNEVLTAGELSLVKKARRERWPTPQATLFAAMGSVLRTSIESKDARSTIVAFKIVSDAFHEVDAYDLERAERRLNAQKQSLQLRMMAALRGYSVAGTGRCLRLVARDESVIKTGTRHDLMRRLGQLGECNGQ